MFYEQLKKACKNKNTSVTAVLKKIGIGTANGTYWKNGSVPSSDIVVQLAEFLDITTDYLLTGKEDYTKKLTDGEQKLLDNYGKLTEEDKKKASKMIEELADEDVSGKKESSQKNKSKGKYIQNISMGNSHNSYVNNNTGKNINIYNNGAEVKTTKNQEENGKCSAIISHLNEFEDEEHSHAILDIKYLLEEKYNMDESNNTEDEIFQYLNTLTKKDFGHAVISIEYMLKREYDVKKNNE